VPNRVQYLSDVIELVVLWRRRYKLRLRDLAEMFLIRGFMFRYEAVLRLGGQTAASVCREPASAWSGQDRSQLVRRRVCTTSAITSRRAFGGILGHFAESCVDEIANARMAKRQRMR
jgi:transposase-like protein